MGRGEGAARVILGLCVLFLVLFNLLSGTKKPRAQRPVVPLPAAPGKTKSGHAGVQTPILNPIGEALRPGAMPTKDGIAVALLIDTSGSMQSRVAEAGGGNESKLFIAERSVVEIVKVGEEHRRKNPEHPLVIGIYEFSARSNQPNVRTVCPPAELSAQSAELALKKLRASGGTPIGDAMILAKQDLDKLGYKKMHLLVLTDGENTYGYQPGDVAEVVSTLPEDHRASVYFVAFDTDAKLFEPVRNAGGLVLSAANAQELRDSLGYVFTGKILAEQPMAPAPAQP